MDNETNKIPSAEEIAAQLKAEEANEATSKEKKPEKDEAAIKQLIELLGSHNSEHKDAGLELLKNEKSIDFLLEAIAETEHKNEKAILVAACWESGLDFKGHEEFFMDLALDNDLFISLEAITVLDSIESKEKAAMEGILKKLNDKNIAKHPNEPMLSDLKLSLEEKIAETL
jgi:4-hydroxy-L-threonine phosphate dehydrogenase PdxA